MRPRQLLDLCNRRCRFFVFLALPNCRSFSVAGYCATANIERVPPSGRARKATSARTLSAERLREVLDYDPEAGHFTPKRRPERKSQDKSWNTRYAKKRAGYLHTPSGYWIICIDDVKYKAHRLAHLYMTGEWSTETVDHRFGKRADNRWSQLRPPTGAQNSLNKELRSDNTSGVKGVSFGPRARLWRAYINVGGIRVEERRFTA